MCIPYTVQNAYPGPECLGEKSERTIRIDEVGGSPLREGHRFAPDHAQCKQVPIDHALLSLSVWDRA